MTQGLTMKIVGGFPSLCLFSVSFKEQLLAENVLARGHKNITIKQISLTKNCCFSGSVLLGTSRDRILLKCLCFPPKAQRSAQELPLVEKQSLDSYPASGGKMMLLSGLNFLPDSKVVFVEKAQGK